MRVAKRARARARRAGFVFLFFRPADSECSRRNPFVVEARLEGKYLEQASNFHRTEHSFFLN